MIEISKYTPLFSYCNQGHNRAKHNKIKSDSSAHIFNVLGALTPQSVFGLSGVMGCLLKKKLKMTEDSR